MGHARARDFLVHFLDTAKDLSSALLAHIGMDGPRVNYLFLQLLNSDRKKKELPDLIDIGSCNLHNMDRAFRNDMKISGWKTKNSLNGAYWLFHDSPARREDYIAQTACSEFPFPSLEQDGWKTTLYHNAVTLSPHLKVTV